MTRHEVRRWEVLCRVRAGITDRATAAQALGRSVRQVQRWLARTAGLTGASALAALRHGNAGRVPANRIAPATTARVVELGRTTYAVFNDTHFTEQLAATEKTVVSRETVRRLRRGDGQRAKRTCRRRAQGHSRRPRYAMPGALVQCDGSLHHWLGPDQPACVLVAAVDDATGALVAAYFAPAETTVSYLQLLAQMAATHGLPQALYHDRHGIFQRNDPHWTLAEELAGAQSPTQLGRACQELGIVSISAHSPEAKGRIERFFGTAQDRLAAELQHAGITTLEAATTYVRTRFLPAYNALFAVPPANPEPAWLPVPPLARLAHALALASDAVVRRDHTVRLGGQVFDIPPAAAGPRRVGHRVDVRQWLDGTWHLYLAGIELATAPATQLVEPRRRRVARDTRPVTYDDSWDFPTGPGLQWPGKGQTLKGTRVA